MSTYNYSTYDNLTSLFTDLGNRLRSKPTAVELTQAQYNALTPAEKADTSKIYMITDQGGGGGGTGLLPYFYIDSEPGSTVTVTAPDGSTIVPIAEGSGHWGCEVTMYGTYVIHSVLAGQGDATISVAVDTVKEYHITDNHFDFTINVTAPNNSTIRITSGTEIYTGTGTGSSQAFAVHQASATYSVAVTMDGNTKTESVTSAATTGQSTNVTFEFGTIVVTVDPDFISAGSTITCTKGGTSCTPKSAASTVTFRVPETGIWVVASEISGQPYSKDAVVSSLATPVTVTLQTVPDGSTVTPTDDIQLWLNCAGIYDKTSYATLDEVLGDKETLQILISDQNAVDYMVRSKTFYSLVADHGITEDPTAMRYIGRRNYAADTLLADEDWCEAILNSAYMTYILSEAIPPMTSNTTPKGVCSAMDIYTSGTEYQSFDGDENTGNYSHSSHVAAPWWIQYEFDSPIVKPKKVKIVDYLAYAVSETFKIQFQDMSNNWVDACEIISSGTTGKHDYDRIISIPDGQYKAVRYYIVSTSQVYGIAVKSLQVYNREDVDETTIDIFSAASDTVYYLDSSNNPVTVATTDTSGKATIQKSLLPNGTYTLYSTVAEDPDNLSNSYSKQVTITDETMDVMVMPDGSVYWYGYGDYLRSSGTGTVTKNTNYLRNTTGVSQSLSVYFDTSAKIYSKASIVFDGYSNWNYNWNGDTVAYTTTGKRKATANRIDESVFGGMQNGTNTSVYAVYCDD